MTKEIVGGRPLKFNSPEELQEKIDMYFEKCDDNIIDGKTKPIPYTITGLASFLDTNRQTLINYENKDEYFDTIKKAKEKIEANLEERALMGTTNVTMAIFSLKNNYNWKDKQEVEQNVTGTISIENILSEIGKDKPNLINE